MSPALITAILVALMLLVIGSFFLSAWLAHRRHLQELEVRKLQEGFVTTGRIMVAGRIHDLPAVIPSAHLSHSWYNRRRSVVSIGLLVMLLIGVLIQTGAAGEVLSTLSQTITIHAAQTSGIGVQTALQNTASTRIVRVDSAAANQYATQYEYDVWSFSSCSGISLEEVMNAYGGHYIASDVLQVESDLGVWDTYDGLTGGEPGMARAAAHFGFTTSPNPPRTLDALIETANAGYPVIVGSPGHILVVKGGDDTYVYLVDSAPANRTAMTHAQFMAFWDGFSVLVLPATAAPS